MHRIVLPMLVLSFIVGCLTCGYSAEQKSEKAKIEEQTKSRAEQTTEQQKASTYINELLGTVPDKPMSLVGLQNSRGIKLDISLCRQLIRLVHIRVRRLLTISVLDYMVRHFGYNNTCTSSRAMSLPEPLASVKSCACCFWNIPRNYPGRKSSHAAFFQIVG
jgi:hypothetical protein